MTVDFQKKIILNGVKGMFG